MIPLVVVSIAVGCLTTAAWMSPKWLRASAARLLARAEGLEAYRHRREDSLMRWREVFGVER